MSAFKTQVVQELASLQALAQSLAAQSAGPSGQELGSLKARMASLSLAALSFKARAESSASYGPRMKEQVAKAWDDVCALQRVVDELVPGNIGSSAASPPPPSSASPSPATAHEREEVAAAAEQQKLRRKQEVEERIAREHAEARERQKQAAQAEKELRRRLAAEALRREQEDAEQKQLATLRAAHAGALRRSQVAPPLRGAVHHVQSRADYQAKLASGATAVVVDWFAPWCGPCRMIAPTYEQFATRDFPDVLFLSVDTEQSMELKALAHTAEVRAFPTFDMFLDGQKLARLEGASPDKLRDAIQHALGKAEELQTNDALALSVDTSPSTPGLPPPGLMVADLTPASLMLTLKLSSDTDRQTTVHVSPPTMQGLKQAAREFSGSHDQRLIFTGRILNPLPDHTTLASLNLRSGMTVVVVPGGGSSSAALAATPLVARGPQKVDDVDEDFVVRAPVPHVPRPPHKNPFALPAQASPVSRQVAEFCADPALMDTLKAASPGLERASQLLQRDEELLRRAAAGEACAELDAAFRH